ncbi:MAG: murein biosynthesis integral membrane protein MurJ [Acidobacteria bacterium]|nr:MAG: murein biosynthesis integral membrane protein MurJ [Acidobacteriota bacterium]
MLVAAGILCSRLAGLVRQRVIAHYFGLTTDAADAWAAGFRIPNFLQNLFGEGALSASFIPVYAALLARGERREADRVASGVGALLALVVSGIVLTGVVATPWLIGAIAPGFTGAKRELTVTVVRILFPGAGLLVMSAWCLGILNSHHRFLLSYAAPVIWSASMIVALLWFGAGTALPRLVAILAWSSVVGSALQFGIQIPVVLRVAPHLGLAPWAFFSRGVVQVSAYIDTLLASLLPTGAVAGLTNAQVLYTLPVSLFGMSVAAAELPAMSGVSADTDGADVLRLRLDSGLRRIAYFVIPSAVAFLALGDIVAAALLQTGRFRHEDAVYVWGILAGSAVGLLASTLGRLYSSTYYALRDTGTPMRYAIVRVVLTTVLGYLFAIPLPRLLGVPPAWGAAGLTSSAGMAGWVEMLLLRATLNARIGRTGLPAAYLAKLWGAASIAAAVAWGSKLATPALHPAVTAILVLGPYGAVFVAMTFAMRVPEASSVFVRFTRRKRIRN